MTDNNTHCQGHRSRLRQRFQQSGFKGFNEHEIIELLLTLCIPRKDVKQPAKQLLDEFKSLHGILNASAEELSQIKGIGNVAPVALQIIREAASLYLFQSAEKGPLLNSSEKLELFWQARLKYLSFEVFEVAYLDSRYRLLSNGVERLQTGTINHTVVYPRKVLESALRRSAYAIVLAHNHPSGKAVPSNHDIKLTRVLLNATSFLNIEILDHLIIADKEIFSFRRNGLIARQKN